MKRLPTILKWLSQHIQTLRDNGHRLLKVHPFKPRRSLDWRGFFVCLIEWDNLPRLVLSNRDEGRLLAVLRDRWKTLF